MSIQAAPEFPEPTLTLAANGTTLTLTRWLVVWAPNMASRKLSPAVRRAEIFEPPEPADCAMEPEVSSTRAISSSMPLATA